jgi:hypothetical protein
MFNKNAFSNGQIDSKLWACQELENLGWSSNLTQIYAGWYGLMAFLLLSREKFNVDQIESYDLDPSCESIANLINENWVIKNGKFKAYTLDCNQDVPNFPDLIINTSTEHFESMDWFTNIPRGTRLLLQGNNMPHEEHCVHSATLEDFVNTYPMSSIVYKGSLDFTYPNWNFTRYMVIGIK